MTPVQLICALAAEWGTSVDELRGVRRTKRIAAMRCIAMALVREQCGSSYPELARLFCRLDHTTALSNVRRAQHYLKECPDVALAAARVLEGRAA